MGLNDQVSIKKKWLLKLQFDQNHELINHAPNCDFNIHIELICIYI
jgi:hypothetical protein